MTATVFQNELVKTFGEQKELLKENEFTRNSRESAFENFLKQGFPDTQLEEWRFTDLAGILDKPYKLKLVQPQERVDIKKFFRCDVRDLDTYTAVVLNGWFIYEQAPITKLPNGTIIGSLATARKEFPELIRAHFEKYNKPAENSFDALNTAFSMDGVFVYIPEGIEECKPIQIINIINLQENMLVQPRNLVIAGKNSRLKLLHCDDIFSHVPTLANSITEFFVDEAARVEYYKMQNNNDHSTLISGTYFNMLDNSHLMTHTISLNGGIIRNNQHVAINGENCECNLYGIYLADKDQLVDNHTYVEHIKPNSTSRELFKGVIDERAHAVFSGRIEVKKEAQKTNAFQTNKNILLTDEATINTKPNLQIYADDVKCSHGATVGQLDQEALFYMRSRGISEESAKMLLMYAFADEVVTKISIDALREKICQLVNKRLKGELSICDQCVLHCSGNEPLVFNIDMSKI